MIQSSMSKRKSRTSEEISVELEQRKARLLELQTKGDEACSQYDLSMGYDAKWYLDSGMIENQIRYLEKELAESASLQASLF